MLGFKRGFDAPGRIQAELGSISKFSEEHLAFALGVLARVYDSVDDAKKLWGLIAVSLNPIKI